MPKNREDLKILYMQIRKDELTQGEEFAGFQHYMNLDESQFVVWNVFAEPDFDVNQVLEFDALVTGGSSDDPKDTVYLDTERYPFIPSAIEVIKKCYEKNIPVCASCMGFLLIIQAFEKKIEFKPEYNEGGIAKTHLTKEAKNDILLCDTPDNFASISFHDKSAMELPEDAVLLTYSDECPRTGFTFPDKPFYAWQFHPEFNEEDLMRILGRYADRYPTAKEELEKCKAKMQSSTESNKILTKFVDRILLK